MSAHAALRLAVRPLRGASLLDQLATAAVPPKPSSRLPPVCLRCRVPANPWAGTSRARLYSTSPPPPRQPPPSDSSENSRNSAETTITQDALSESPAPSTSSTPPPPPQQPEPEVAAPSEPPTQPETPSSSSTSEPFSEQPSQTPPPPTEEPTNTNSSSPSSSSSPDPSLPSFTETHRHPLSARFSTFMDNLQSRAVTATQTINDLTGYSAIEAIKKQNILLEQEHAASQQRLRAARQNYKSLTTHRASTQREVTTLLARKDTWNPLDLERFTTLYRSDHELESQVAAAAAELTEAEADESRLSGALNAGILKRYHEEQIWSDRIRRQSTWGTWGLMGVNVVLFLVLQFVAEPWRRKRLMRGIAESEKGVMDEVRRELGEVKAALEASGLKEAAAAVAVAAERAIAVAEGQEQDSINAAVAAAPEPVHVDPMPPMPRRPWKEILAEYWADPEIFKEDVQTTFQDLYSDRKADLSMRDVSVVALQSAAAGATVVAALALALLHSSSA